MPSANILTGSGLDKSRLASIAARFSGKRIGVVGDVMLDIYTHGTIERVLPEVSLVPIFKSSHEEFLPGGAGNVAANIASLGADAVLYSRIGTDDSGKKLQEVLEARGVPTDTLHEAHEGVPTITKQRIVSEGNVVVRVDTERTEEAPDEHVSHYIARIVEHLPTLDGLVIADYRKGFITERLVRETLAAARTHQIPIVVDSKKENAHFFKDSGASVITPNSHEAFAMADTKDPHTAGKKLREFFGFPVLVTRGRKGMLLVMHSNETYELPPTHTIAAIDVSGAGDTVSAVCALALSGGATLPEAAFLANLAGGIVVGKPGTATVILEEFTQRIHDA